MVTAKSASKQVLKLVTPKPQLGPAGVIVPVVAGGVILVGGYILLTRVLNLDFISEFLKKVSPIYPTQQAVADSLGLPDPDPVLGQWGNMWNDVANIFTPEANKVLGPGGATSVSMTVSPTTVARGEPFTITGAGWLPDKPVYYGIDGLAYPVSEQLTASATGTVSFTDSGRLGGYQLGYPPGTYSVYLDQIGWGGRRLTKSITITGGGF